MPEPPDWRTLDAAFDRALDLDGPDRQSFLDGLDAETRAALAPLMRDAEADDPLLDHPRAALAGLAAGLDAGTVGEGVRVGPYAVGALVGEGGMGRVYRAHRADGAFDATVALKVVRHSLTLAGADVAARLRRERDLLAALDHPGIARLLDGGETPDGVPYLVTEFVDGPPLTDYCEARALGVRQRVGLVAEVARAVDHAHRRFVVHRDLKPSNVLVAERDGRARPVVLDFGIAKLLDAADDATGAFPLTRTGMRLLTPAYAAPELYEPAATVTTAADVYGLGALLYEVLTGHRPHDDAPTGGPARTEPTRPSRIVVGGAPAPAAPSALRGDLDVICLKALHPDPARRYGSAAALADDLARYLGGQPVEARPDSAAYVFGRFVRRHRAPVAAAAVALVALVAGLGVSLAALTSEREARAETERAAARATEAAEVLAGMFQTANPDYADGRAVTVAEAVEEGVDRVRAIESAPLRAFLLRALGETYVSLGEPARADSLFRDALALHGEDATGDEVSRVRRQLVSTRDALADPRRVLELSEHLLRDHPDDAARTQWWMARAHLQLGEHARAVGLSRQVLEATRDAAPRERVRANEGLSAALSAAGQHPEALSFAEEAVRIALEAFGERSGRTSDALVTLGRARSAVGDHAGAEAALRRAIAFHAERYGPDRIAYPLAALGEVQLAAGRHRQAAALFDSAATMARPITGPDHPDVARWRTRAAQALASTSPRRPPPAGR